MKRLMQCLETFLFLVTVVVWASRAAAEENRVQPADPADALRRQVAGLYSHDVAWRQIQWKTCLLEGLKESRQSHKPLLLWIFIDRPVDDERC